MIRTRALKPITFLESVRHFIHQRSLWRQTQRYSKRRWTQSEKAMKLSPQSSAVGTAQSLARLERAAAGEGVRVESWSAGAYVDTEICLGMLESGQ
jgi:hypothetical protein